MLTKVKLTDDERSRIRWASTKKGFVVHTTFQPVWSRRGPRDVQSMRSQVFTTQIEAAKHADTIAGKDFYVRGTQRMLVIDDITVLRVDALGNVQETIR